MLPIRLCQRCTETAICKRQYLLLHWFPSVPALLWLWGGGYHLIPAQKASVETNVDVLRERF